MECGPELGERNDAGSGIVYSVVRTRLSCPCAFSHADSNYVCWLLESRLVDLGRCASQVAHCMSHCSHNDVLRPGEATRQGRSSPGVVGKTQPCAMSLTIFGGSAIMFIAVSCCCYHGGDIGDFCHK